MSTPTDPPSAPPSNKSFLSTPWDPPPQPPGSDPLRPVPMQFDEDFNLHYQSATTPTSFKVRALALIPPRRVVPIILVPGIMGTNLKQVKNSANQPIPPEKQPPVWQPPNGNAPFGELFYRGYQSTKSRQEELNPDTTDVDDRGKVELSDAVNRRRFFINDQETATRGWGEIHHASYAGILEFLELALNEQRPGSYLGTHAVWKKLSALTADDFKNWQAHQGQPTPLSPEELKDAVRPWYFPVFACGYNWLQSNETSADRLHRRVQAIKKRINASNWCYFEKCILVTHSMGGLVARRYAQKYGEADVLGIVHGVQPVDGAPAVYRRFRAGTEAQGKKSWSPLEPVKAFGGAVVLGWSAADVTAVMANGPGPLELLPNQRYHGGKPWLHFKMEAPGSLPVEASLPQHGDPYTEIYGKQDVWWRMVDETLIDPANLIPKNHDNRTPFKHFLIQLQTAKDFHTTLGDYFHPQTYGYWGDDTTQQTYASLTWRCTQYQQNGVTIPAIARLNSQSMLAMVKTGDSQLGGVVAVESAQRRQQGSAEFAAAEGYCFTLSGKNGSGDGTVPIESGAALACTKVKQAFKLKGFDHQGSYNDEVARMTVLYSIIRLAQTLPAPIKK